MKKDPKTDNLLTPENAALIIIDYQPLQINSINSMSRAALVKNITTVAKLAKAFKLPVVLSTVNVKNHVNEDTIPQIKQVLGDIPSIDRTTINSWEDEGFYNAVKATNRKKLIITALWTEACLIFPTLDALAEGYEVYPVVDAIGGTSTVAHEAALRHVELSGAKPISIPQLACELQRDWARHDTVKDFLNIMYDAGIFLKLN
ncbi:MAG: hydrolase [Alphaproteobacteria bacterium]|jgi:nicotinamidase-related amidase|nr:hydrolase [Alphaproteobacteria bacterium]